MVQYLIDYYVPTGFRPTLGVESQAKINATNSSRSNTYTSLSKQTTLTTPGMIDLQKTGAGGVSNQPTRQRNSANGVSLYFATGFRTRLWYWLYVKYTTKPMTSQMINRAQFTHPSLYIM